MNAYQSGASIVAPGYRGKGLFSSLLNFVHDRADLKAGMDFLVGFPVEASYRSFLLNGWSNILDLVWYVRPIAFLTPFRHSPNSTPIFDRQRGDIKETAPRRGFVLQWDNRFDEWRMQLPRAASDYYYFHYRKGKHCVRFDLKTKTRGCLKELIIGRVTAPGEGGDILAEAVNALARAASQAKTFHFISFACNRFYCDTSIVRVFRRSLFFPIAKRIHFVVRNTNDSAEIFRPELWALFVSDIDTW